MKMDRRSFLRWAGAAGAMTLVPTTVWRALADGDRYRGPLLVTVHAGGGWDPLFFTDPKENAAYNRVTLASGSAGAIRFADHDVDPVGLGYDVLYEAEYTANMLTNRAFFERWGARTTVFNGVDTRTNNHDTGTRYVWSGRSTVGHPSIGALVAAAAGGTHPLGYVSQGGYDFTAGLVALSRAASPTAMRRIAAPNLVDPSRPEGDRYLAGPAWDRVVAAQRARLERMRAAEGLPAAQRAMRELESARRGSTDLERLVLSDALADLPGFQLNDLERTMQQTDITMAALRDGLAVAASLTLGGFDTHGNHDRDHVRQLAKLLRGVDYVLEQAAVHGLADRVMVVVGSDFGRTPTYNSQNGKDHWPATSMLAIFPESMAARFGNRLIGATDDAVRPRKLSPSTLEPNDSGVPLTPAGIHRALRRFIGIEASDGAQRFPLTGEDLPLFE